MSFSEDMAGIKNSSNITNVPSLIKTHCPHFLIDIIAKLAMSAAIWPMQWMKLENHIHDKNI
jgi:hypothetical protein